MKKSAKKKNAWAPTCWGRFIIFYVIMLCHIYNHLSYSRFCYILSNDTMNAWMQRWWLIWHVSIGISVFHRLTAKFLVPYPQHACYVVCFWKNISQVRNLIGRESWSRLRPVSSLEFQLFQSRFGGTERTSLSLPCGLFQTHTFNSMVILTTVISACMRGNYFNPDRLIQYLNFLFGEGAIFN